MSEREPDTVPRGTRVAPASVIGQVGQYRLVQELGSGGMGVVYLALNPYGRAVALKMLRPELVADTGARARLGREVATSRRVRHPRVAAVLDADVDGPEPYVVTEYVPGVPLDEVVEEEGRLSREELLLLARGLADALEAIHAAGVVHRDLKPSNVMLVESGPVVIDFGIAHVGDEARLTSTGLVMGTPGYVTPEMIEGAPITPATDWWGWAVTLAYAASGEPPYGRGSVQTVLARVLAGRADLSGVDPLLAPLLAGALAVDPTRRLSTQDVMEGLERYGRGEPALLPDAVDTAGIRLPDERAGYVPPHHGASVYREPPTPPDGMAVPVTASEDLPIQPWVWHGDPRAELPARSTFIGTMLIALTALAAVVPTVALCVLLLWSVVARTVDGSMSFLVLRRHQKGPRRHDRLFAALLSPWHLVAASAGAVLALLLPATLGLVTAALALLGLWARYDVGHGHLWAVPAAVAVLTTAWASWWGFGGSSLRRGTRTLVRQVTGTRVMRTGTMVVLALVATVLTLACISADGSVHSWWPTSPPPVDRWFARKW